MTMDRFLARRAFLARLGVLGAVATVGGMAPPLSASANPVLDTAVDLLRPVLAELARDTINGAAAFVVPGPDAYSRAQGTPRPEPGALEAKAPDFLMQMLDTYVPFPDEIAQPVAMAFATGLADVGIALPGALGTVLPAQVKAADDALRVFLESDESIPLSLAVALALNLVASQVNPASLRGPFLAPFSRLSFAEKAEVFRLIEGPDSSLVALLDTEFPQPLNRTASGLVKFLGGAVLELLVFGTYTEWAVYDPRTRELPGRPVGWQLTGYRPHGLVEGNPDFQGYYQGRTKVSDR
jgi:hypothetical protein